MKKALGILVDFLQVIVFWFQHAKFSQRKGAVRHSTQESYKSGKELDILLKNNGILKVFRRRKSTQKRKIKENE